MMTLPSPSPVDLRGLKQKLQALIASETAWITKGGAGGYPAPHNIECWQSMLETVAATDRQVAA